MLVNKIPTLDGAGISVVGGEDMEAPELECSKLHQKLATYRSLEYVSDVLMICCRVLPPVRRILSCATVVLNMSKLGTPI